MDLKSKLRHVMNFPKEGIDYIDITTVLQDPASLREAVNQMKAITEKFGEFDLIVAPEARGFIFGVPLAYQMNKGFVPIRKKGKLPYSTVSMEYSLEYGTSILEMHEDAIKKGQRVVVVDDLMATSGTTEAIIRLVEKMGGQVVGISIFVELEFLKGREKLKNYKVESVVKL